MATVFDVIFWALVSSTPLVAGAVLAVFLKIPQKIVAIIMALGSGALISVITFSLMREAYHMGGIIPVSIGFMAGALILSIGNHNIKKRVLKIKKSPTTSSDTATTPSKGAGISLALGSLLDNIPEGLSIGVSLLVSNTIGISLVVAIAISNFSEAIGGAEIMKFYKKRLHFIIGMWSMIAISNVLASVFGFSLLSNVGEEYLAIALSFAAGSILGMLGETMMPEVYKIGGYHISVATAVGFLLIFILIARDIY